jgi:hypothetical protein
VLQKNSHEFLPGLQAEAAGLIDQLFSSSGYTAGTKPTTKEKTLTVINDYQRCSYKSEADGNRTRNPRIDSPVL